MPIHTSLNIATRFYRLIAKKKKKKEPTKNATMKIVSGDFLVDF